MNQPVYIDRPPRIQPELPIDTLKIPAPPSKNESGFSQLVQIALPLLTIIGYVAMAMMGGMGRNPAMMIPMALSVLAATGFSVYSYMKERQERAAAERAYMERLTELNREMHNYHDMQRRFYSYNYSDWPTTFRIARDARYEAERSQRTLRAETRLWERRRTDEDFGVVRLGMGTLPSTVLYELEGGENTEGTQVRAAQKLQEDSRFVSNIPVIISLRATPEVPKTEDTDEQEGTQQAKEEGARRTPVTHALGIAGNRACVYEHIRSFLAHFVVFHAPMDARLYVLASHRQEWGWTETVPHCRGDENTRYSFFLDAKEEEYRPRRGRQDEESPLTSYLEGIRKVLAQRKLQLQESEGNEAREDPTFPFCLVVVDLMDAAYDKSSPLHDLEADPALSILLAEGATLGAAVIFLVPERSKVPSGCKSVIEIEKTTPATNARSQEFQRLHFRYAETGLNSFRYVGEADEVSRPDDLQELAERLAQVDVRQSSGAALATAVPFMAMMGYRTLSDLEQDALQKWEESRQPACADWLRAKLGLMSGNKARTLTFSAKHDGVHGMVAGSTGSGKSELLISLITGMAVTYDPSTLNFVLVDYKGGGAFKEFEALPHCVDIITNLAGEGVTRMFTAINAEMRRRQQLNTETGTKNIVEYRQKGLHNSYRPYPFLFIIIDEFAEMIADRAEYKAELETITRVGRAQGVSLILAAQRPSGVTDQMRSNIKFRISLRVETVSESREMLRRADAAYLPGGLPGRGYLQVGNEEIELIQVAYSGDKYEDPTQTPREDVLWPDRDDTYDPTRDQEPPELYKAVVASLARLAREQRIPEQRAPWPGFLPTRLSLSTVLISPEPNDKPITSERYLEPAQVSRILMGGQEREHLSLNPSLNRWLNEGHGWIEGLDWEQHALRPVVGLADNPQAAQQLPLVVELPRGHVAVFGASGWGKTTFLRSLVVSLAATHSPQYAHVYLLDLGGRGLKVLERLPHVGAVISPDEEGYKERVEQLLRELDEMVESRKALLASSGMADIYVYNAAHPAEPLPAVVVGLDNFTEFKETFGGSGEANVESVLDRFTALARESRPYGIHLVITVSQPSALSLQLFNVFTERFALKLADPTDYRILVGASIAEIGDVPGRGYARFDRETLSFQVAIPLDPQRDGLEETGNESQEVEYLAHHMHDFIARSGREYKLPSAIGALPRSVLLKQILARQFNLPLDDNFLEALKEKARQLWEESTRPGAKSADWLKVTIALAPGDRLRELHLEAKQDGVHGLVAGGTGAGKSELLMTLIVGLALRYDPSILNFVLVDYKGGGAFKPFESLPHCVDIVTNLNKAAVRRMFTSINAEMQRRQKLNADTGTKDIVEYRAKGYHLTREPYPHLFIIIDEYAEMIADNPEYRADLESITRVGRAQGVNLLLASQRPAGVTDQMRANIKFRICLRVEEVETSREMLRRSDAAFLPNGVPGRGYLQVGNEFIELIQVAYTGETHDASEVREGSRAPKFYDIVVDMAKELLQSAPPRTPWPPFLPRALTLTEPLGESYLDQNHHPLITPGRNSLLALNPFLQEWLYGGGGWPGIDWSRQAMRSVVGLLDDPYNARQLPLIVDLTKGHAVIFGASGWGKTTFLRSLVLSLAATHSPDEFQAHLLDLGGRNLEVLRALPHVGTIIMPDERGYEERVQQLLRELNDIADKRKRLVSEAGVSTLYEYNRAHPEQIEPGILIAIDNFAEYLETFGQGKENDPNNLLEVLVALVRQAKAYGVHFVISVSRLNVLTSKLYSLFTERLALRLSDATDYSGIVGGRVDEVEEIAGRGYTRVERQALAFQIALPPDTLDELGQVRGEATQIRAISQCMQAYLSGVGRRYREPLRIAALPESSSYRQVLTEEFALKQERGLLDELTEAVQQRWEYNATAKGADWLQLTLGIASGNRRRTLHLEAQRDGVHGMVAGGTGSGKSELLMTLIVGLALNYSPQILNFVLVDYKGGGAFKPFERLPHCVDIVTNLNKSGVDRMFTAINAEIRRRQKLNADTGTKDIIEYRSKGLHLEGDSYPHLFVIVDEYAEMIDDNPEYKAQLESITRVGRAQGVNLLLASQRPKGVTDQMRANIKLRLCLRVEQTDTSVELLRRPDAAFLPNGIPGRGYLQVGNENLELIQVAYTGEPQPDERETGVLWPKRAATAIVRVSEDVPKLFDMAVTMASELAGGKMAPKLWPTVLPRSISLQSPLYDAQKDRWTTLTTAVTDWLNDDLEEVWPGIDWSQEALRAVVGLVDDPVEARQLPLRFDLKREHLVVYGDSGWGKTSLLRSVITSLAASHSPDELHVYVLDLGGRGFRSVEQFPHVGAVLYADEDSFEERLHRLLEKLDQMTDHRQQVLSSAGVNHLYEFNQRFPERALPAVLVVVDDFAQLLENYELLIDTTVLPLIRRSLAVGISFAISANGPNNITSKLSALFGQRITFKQSNPDRYMDIVGRGAIELDDIAGRGYLRMERRPMLFQAALAVGALYGPDGQDSLLEADELQHMAHNMQRYMASGRREWRETPDPIETLPELVPLVRLLEQAPLVRRNRVEAVLGQSGDLRPALVDLKRMLPHFIISGPPLSGKTTLLYNCALSLAYRYPPSQVALILVDLQRRFVEYGGARSLAELPHVLATVYELEQLEGVATALKKECTLLTASNPPKEIFVVIDNFDDTSEEIERHRALESELAGLVRRYGREGLHFVVAGALDGGVSELKRRIQAANFGIGLRTAQALDALRVMRTPAGFRGKELPIGRGYMVRSGQATLIQAASPYEGLNGSDSGSVPEEVEDQHIARPLDSWVELIQGRYPGQKAEWSATVEQVFSTNGASHAQSEATRQMLHLLQRAMRWETRRLREEKGVESVLTAALAGLDAAGWNDEGSLLRVLTEVWREEMKANGLSDDVVNSMDPTSLLMDMEASLPSVEKMESTA